MVTREDVLDCYRFLLDREPESETVITEKCKANDLTLTIEGIIASTEFLNLHKLPLESHFDADQGA